MFKYQLLNLNLYLTSSLNYINLMPPAYILVFILHFELKFQLLLFLKHLQILFQIQKITHLVDSYISLVYFVFIHNFTSAPRFDIKIRNDLNTKSFDKLVHIRTKVVIFFFLFNIPGI